MWPCSPQLLMAFVELPSFFLSGIEGWGTSPLFSNFSTWGYRRIFFQIFGNQSLVSIYSKRHDHDTKDKKIIG